MRHRRWVVVLAVFLLAVLPLALVSLEIASRNPAVRRAVLSRIIPEIAGELSIGQLEIGLGSLEFGDVAVDLAEGGFVRVPSATASISLRRLLFAGASPREALSSIVVTDPVVAVNYGGSRGQDEGAGPAFDVASLESYLPDYLGVSNATVVFTDVRTGRGITVESVDFLLERKDDGPAVGEALGSVLGGSGNVSSQFTWDPDSRTLKISGALAETPLSNDLPVPPAIPVAIDSGAVSARFLASVSPDSVRGLDLDFSVSNADLTLTSVGEEVSSVSADGRFNDGVLTIRSAEGEWRSASWTAAGAIRPAGGEISSMEFSGSGLPLGRSLTLIGLDGDLADGTVDVVADVSGSFDRPVLDVSVRGRGLSAHGLSIADGSLDGRFEPGAVHVHDLRADALGGRMRFSGSALRAEDSGVWGFELTGEAQDLRVAEITEAVGIDTASAGRLSLTDIRAGGTFDRPEFESLLAWSDVSLGPVRPGTGVGGVLLSGGSLSLSLASSGRTFDLSGVADDVFGEPSVDVRLSLTDAALDSLLAAGDRHVPPLVLNGEIVASGPADSLELRGNLRTTAREASATVELVGTAVGGAPRGRPGVEVTLVSSDASVRGVKVPFTAHVSVSAESVAVKDLRVGDYAHADAVIGFGDTGRIAAGIVVSEAPLSDALLLATGGAPRGVDGLLFASVSIRGTLDDPAAGAQISIGNASMAGVEDLDLVTGLELTGREFVLTDFALRHLRRPVFSATGGGLVGGPIEFTVIGEDIPGPLLGGSPQTFFDAALGIGGTTGSPTFDGRLESSSQGELLGIPFDTCAARVSGANGIIHLERLALERRGDYLATAEGDVPVGAVSGSDAEGTISMDVTGNPIALLGELTGIGKSGEGSGSFRAVLVGNRETATLASARLEARAERFWPASFFPRLDDVEMSVDVSDGAVVFGRVVAESGGNTIELVSERGAVAEGRELEPLVIGGVDAGVLALSTEGRGVTANVPGLMLPDDVGRIAISGRDGAPAFLIGGPTDSPYIWGEIEFSDLSFTYPSMETDGEEVGDLLSDARWSVRMTAGRNLWYWRPDANLNIERGRSLDFVGTPSDHTLCVSGRVTSSKGTLTYLYSEFDVREVSVDFPAFCEPPRFQVEAETRVADGTAITLTVNTTEDIPVFRSPGVTLEESEIVLVSDAPEDDTPEKIMAKLQYGVSYDLLEAEEQAALERRRAVELLGTQIGLRVTRPLLSPIESRIRRALNLDLVRIDIDFVEHFLAEIDMWSAQEGTSQYTPFIADTRMTLGKYISRSFLLSYLGVLESYESEIGVQALGLRSEAGIEYEVSRNTSLSMRIVYDPSISGWDRRISIENRFDF